MVRLLKRRHPTIRRQLLAIALVPSISLIAVALATSAYLAVDARNSGSLQQTVAAASAPAAQAIRGLQEERRLSLARLSGESGREDEMQQVRQQVMGALGALSGEIGPLLTGSESTAVQRQMGSLSRSGEQLMQLRAAVDSGQIDVTTTYQAYSQMLSGFGASLRTATQEAPDARSAHDQLTSVDLFYGAESLWRSTTLTEVALINDGLPDALAEDFRVRSGAYRAQLDSLAEALGESERAELSAVMDGPAWRQITQVEAALGQHLAQRSQNEAGSRDDSDSDEDWSPVSLRQWRASVDEVGQVITTLYAQHSQAAAERSDATVHDQEVRAWVVGAVLLMLGLSVVLVAVRMSGRVAHRLRRLRDDTRRLSSKLPETVDRLRRGKEPEPGMSPLRHGDDEIGEVAEAFNDAQELALRAAADEAKARAGTREVFLNIARRTQGISYQQLKLLDQAQEHVEEPGHLKLLFQLDHLATRARRHAENLVILGGKQPGRRWSRPVPLIDVVRGATGETVNYEQVLARRIPEVSVAADKAADLIHILAELIDNATSFGPPSSTVEVSGQVVGKGVVLEVEDRGLGMPREQREQLNRQLSEAPDFGDMALTGDTRLGLFVVGHLATRHEIRVTLRESTAYGGIIAVLLIPHPVLVEPLAPHTPPAVAPATPVTGMLKTVPATAVRPPGS